MKLQSMTDFVLNLMQSNSVENWKKIGIIEAYANFLKQPLTLGMFIACDEYGNVLEEPDFFDGSYDDNGYGDVDKIRFKNELNAYQQAKEKVLFDFGYDMTIVIAEDIINAYETIEGMAEFLEPTLTPNAIKHLGL